MHALYIHTMPYNKGSNQLLQLSDHLYAEGHGCRAFAGYIYAVESSSSILLFSECCNAADSIQQLYNTQWCN